MALRPRKARGIAASNDPKTNEFLVPLDDEDALVAWMEKKRQAGRSRMPMRQMKMNLAYVLGEQWLVWDQDRRQFIRPRVRPNDPNAPVRITANKLGGIVEHYIARLLKQDLEPEVRPVSDDEDDVSAAKVGTRILDSEMNRIQWDSTLMNLYFWVVPLGWSYLQIAWDADNGDAVGDDEAGEAVYQGNITVDIVPGFELSVDPNGKKRDLTDSRWAVRSISMTPEAIWETWGVKVSEETNERSLAEEVYDLVEHHGDERPKERTVQVHQFWLRPGSRAKPDGMVVTWSGKTILDPPKPFPYHHGRLPFVQWDLLPGLGTREGRTWVKDAVPLQADYNDARSREAGIRRTLVPKLLAPVGSIDPQRVGSRVEIVTYNPVGTPPTWEIPNAASAMQGHEMVMNRADQEMGARSGQTDINFGTRTAAAAILAMQEADDTKLSIASRLNAEAIQIAGWMILELVRQYWIEQRVVRAWSEEGDLEVYRFQGSDIAHQIDVRVTVESSLPKSKAARVQLAMELQGMGLIPDPRAFFQMIDLPGTDFIVASLNLDAKAANRENSVLITGQAVEVNSFDNHMVHIQEHNNFRKSEDYAKLSPQVRAVIDAHVDAHQGLVLQQMSVPTPPGTPFMPGLTPPGGAGEGMVPPGQVPQQPGNAIGMKALAQRAGMGGKVNMAELDKRAGVGEPEPFAPAVRRMAGIGRPGQPGQVPGHGADRQAASMGE